MLPDLHAQGLYPAFRLLQPLPPAVQFRYLGPQLGGLLLLLFQLTGQPAQFLVDRGQFLRQVSNLLHLAAHLAQGPFHAGGLVPGLVQPFPGLGLQKFVVFKTDYLGQDRLAVGGGAVAELVGLALQQKGRVGEGLEVHADGLVDLGLGLPDRIAGYGLRAGRPQHLELEVGHALAASAAGAGVSAHRTVVDAASGEVQLHPALVGAVGNHVVLGPAPGPAPQAPGYGVQKGGLAVAVGAAQAGQVDTGKVQVGDPFPVA